LVELKWELNIREGIIHLFTDELAKLREKIQIMEIKKQEARRKNVKG